MGDDDRREGPSLELPSWRLGRRRRSRADEAGRHRDDRDAAVGSPAPPAEAEAERPLLVDEAPTAPLPRTPEREPAAPDTAGRPALAGVPAAILTGVAVGLAAVALTWASERGCGALRGTSSCGGGPGFLLLVAILVVMATLGAGLLRALAVPGPGSTSVLGTGLLAVITMLFFVDVVFDWWMSIVVPLCAALTYALAHRVTTTYVEPQA